MIGCSMSNSSVMRVFILRVLSDLPSVVANPGIYLPDPLHRSLSGTVRNVQYVSDNLSLNKKVPPCYGKKCPASWAAEIFRIIESTHQQPHSTRLTRIIQCSHSGSTTGVAKFGNRNIITTNRPTGRLLPSIISTRFTPVRIGQP